MASGETLAIFTPHSYEPTSTNFATLDLRNLHPILDYDDSTNEDAVFTGVLPKNYSGGGLTVEMWVAATSATSGNFDVDVAIERILAGTTDLDSDSFAAANSSDNNTVDGTSGVTIKVTVTFTNGSDMDSLVAGEPFRIKVTRDATNDTATGDMELLVVHILET